jgi:predicted NBD/HSP70 family sugar kinase
MTAPAPVLAIDLGGTSLRAGIADSARPEAVRQIGSWPAPRTLYAFNELIAHLLAEQGASRLGIGIPGLARGTVCAWVPNLGYLDGIDLARLFPNIEIALGNDAQFALVAEASAGAGRGLTDVILLAIGTGIGSAVLADGRIVKGSNGGACSFGWAVADPGDKGDDRSGWLERHASGRALDIAADRLGLGGGMALIAAVRNGHPAASAALIQSMGKLGTALAGAVALLDPQKIIVAGGLAAEADVITPPALSALRRHLPPHLRGIEIAPGYFGPRAGLVGAAFAGSRGKLWGALGD